MLSLTQDVFGSAVDPISLKLSPIRRFTFSNSADMTVQLITLGATITSIRIPDKRGIVEDVVLGYDELGKYLNAVLNPYFGSTIGRVTNRIRDGKFLVAGMECQATLNCLEKHSMHGGFVGFNMLHWTVLKVDKQNCAVVLAHTSEDGHQGFPGEMTVRVRFQLFPDSRFTIKYTAKTTKSTPVSISSHSYFNLAGHNKQRDAVYDHHIAINADKITVLDADFVPTGRFLNVAETMFDFKEMKELARPIRRTGGLGFDHNFCCNVEKNTLTPVARAVHIQTGRWMEIQSDQPGLHLYTANYLPDVRYYHQFYPGKESAQYYKHGGFCLVPQAYPDAINHTNFPNMILRPGRIYEHNIVYQFGVTCRFEKNNWIRKFENKTS